MSGTRRDPTSSRSASGPGRRRPLTAPEWEKANRLGLLLLHALIGLLVGLLILFNGTAEAFEQYGDRMRLLTGGLAFVGGTVLAAGLAWRSITSVLEMAGLAILSLWSLVMAGGLILVSLGSGVLSIDWPWKAFSTTPSERLYPIAIYLGLFLMTSLHLWTTWRVRQLDLTARHRGTVTGGPRLSDLQRGPVQPGQQRVIETPEPPSSMMKQPSLKAWRVGASSIETLPPNAQR